MEKVKLIRISFVAVLIAQMGAASHSEGLAYLRHYCKSCHAVGANRFIISNDDHTLWEYIRNSRAPSGDLWVDAIVDTLNWPENKLPGVNDRTSANRRYMPLGSKREDIFTDMINGENARLFIYDSVSSTSIQY